MYLTYLASAVALLVGLLCYLALGFGWFWSPVVALIVLVATWIIGTRRISARMAPAMQQFQRQVQAGHVLPAIETLESMLPSAKWVPLATGQIYSQMGILAWRGQQRERALPWLAKASPRVAEARMLYASILYKDDRKAEALKVLETAEPFNARNALLFNMHAWLLNQEGRTDEAIGVLNKLLARESAHEVSKDNLLRLQNGRKMNMKPFDLQWYSLGFERPPASMGEMRTGRKGFRQPPKRKKG